MRADPAARRGVAHHQVVEPEVGDEGEALQQLAPLRQEVVHTLHQQRPATRGQAPEKARLERAMLNFPAA